MFKVKPQAIGDIVNEIVRSGGLETPLLQKRVIDAWDEVVGEFVTQHTKNKYIKNQTLFVKISSPALRSDLMMRREALITTLNKKVGSFVIFEIKFY